MGIQWNRAVEWELICDRALAERLGAVSPITAQHHRRLRDAGHLLVRDPATGWGMFWPWAKPVTVTIRESSSGSE